MSSHVYQATYSNIPVYEFMCNDIAVMKRQSDSFLNATQILKVAEFDKVQRTRILEREIQTGQHEKVQGGYGKYQGTWVPFQIGVALAQNYHVDEVLRPILDFQKGEKSPPLAPKYYPKLKRREPPKILPKEQPRNYTQYLVQHFAADNDTRIPPILVHPPPDLDVNIIIDEEGHTSLHWAAALGRAELVNRLIKLGADTCRTNYHGHTALMRSVLFARCFESRSFPIILSALKHTIHYTDKRNQTVFHHASSISGQKGKVYASRYYIHCLLDMIDNSHILNMRDEDGRTALSIASNKEVVNLLVKAGADRRAEIAKDQRRLFGLFEGMYERDYAQTNQLLKEKREQLELAKKELEHAKRRVEYIQCDQQKLKDTELVVQELSKLLRRQINHVQKENLKYLISKYSKEQDHTQQINESLHDLQERRRKNTERLVQLRLRSSSKRHQQYERIIAKCTGVSYEKVDSILQPLLLSIEQNKK